MNKKKLNKNLYYINNFNTKYHNTNIIILKILVRSALHSKDKK